MGLIFMKKLDVHAMKANSYYICDFTKIGIRFMIWLSKYYVNKYMTDCPEIYNMDMMT